MVWDDLDFCGCTLPLPVLSTLPGFKYYLLRPPFGAYLIGTFGTRYVVSSAKSRTCVYLGRLLSPHILFRFVFLLLFFFFSSFFSGNPS